MHLAQNGLDLLLLHPLADAHTRVALPRLDADRLHVQVPRRALLPVGGVG